MCNRPYASVTEEPQTPEFPRTDSGFSEAQEQTAQQANSEHPPRLRVVLNNQPINVRLHADYVNLTAVQERLRLDFRSARFLHKQFIVNKQLFFLLLHDTKLAHFSAAYRGSDLHRSVLEAEIENAFINNVNLTCEEKVIAREAINQRKAQLKKYVTTTGGLSNQETAAEISS